MRITSIQSLTYHWFHRHVERELRGGLKTREIKQSSGCRRFPGDVSSKQSNLVKVGIGLILRSYLNFRGCEEEGLYRVPGSGTKIKYYQERFDRGKIPRKSSRIECLLMSY